MSRVFNFRGLRSIQAKVTILIVAAIFVSMTVGTIIGMASISKIGTESAKSVLMLMCETGQKNLDSYFVDVEESVKAVSNYVTSDLDAIELDQLHDHVERSREYFRKVANRTNGVLTYYYRFDPNFTDTEEGFWYIDLDGKGFEEHAPTSLHGVDLDNDAAYVWFTQPRKTRAPIWLPPYITDNLDVYVISYNVPIYRENEFVGVVGIEIDYTTMATQVDNIKLYKTGYAFINDAQGKIIYHPEFDALTETDPAKIQAPKGIVSDDKLVYYTYNGVEKMGVWLDLGNGMRLNVSVPTSEINGEWQKMTIAMGVGAAAVLAVFVVLTILFARELTKPLRELTKAAQQINEGNYDVKLDYKGSDEIGILTQTVSQLIDHLEEYIGDLNSIAYTDPLTSARTRNAFELFAQETDKFIQNKDGNLAFALALFDCDDLKGINDLYGHDKGDLYLTNAAQLILRALPQSTVYRIGGDEFIAVMMGPDYENREELINSFMKESDELTENAIEPYDAVRVSVGLAVFDPNRDQSVEDVVKRADALMYENKKKRKGI